MKRSLWVLWGKSSANCSCGTSHQQVVHVSAWQKTVIRRAVWGRGIGNRSYGGGEMTFKYLVQPGFMMHHHHPIQVIIINTNHQV